LNLNPKLLYEVTKISPYARGSSTRDGIEPRHGRRVAPTAGRQSAAGAGAGDFKKSHCHLPADPGPVSRYHFIAAQRGYYPARQLDQPPPTQANRVWVSDISYLPLANCSWVNLCAFQNVASKHVVGWQAGAAMPEELVTIALQRAFWAQPPTPGPS